MHRMVWACVLVTLVIVVSRQWRDFKALLLQAKLVFKLFIASVLVSVNWAVFIWAVNTGHLVETSLGYFMNPLISVVLGVVIFGEALRRGQLVALSIAAISVIYLVFSYGVFPWISLVLAVTFALYGAVKKSVSVPATHGLAIETMCLLIPAAAYLLYIESRGSGQFLALPTNAWLLVLGGLFTLVPLVLFASAAKRISMTALGMTQYIGPSLQLLIGVFIYGESFGSQKMIAFGLIWLALGIYSMDQLRHQNGLRRARKAQKIKTPS